MKKVDIRSDIVTFLMSSGRILRAARHRSGVSQRALAIRAGTSQAAISRLEREHQSPTVGHLRSLLRLLGEDLSLEARPTSADVDSELLRQNLRLSPSERLENLARLANFLRSARPARPPE